ncbi:CIA30 family protein [Luteimonas deserti]|uniref:CIA30 family protein n=1 Tax=Luteimonas deserti TaxID=2752306 RepID=A0A7Z0QPF2_9GAMM|nr:CIA30 family protein [Luteimonas deserti]NYZ61784.1 CIA30 family protein [Luteimonas deserti]
MGRQANGWRARVPDMLAVATLVAAVGAAFAMETRASAPSVAPADAGGDAGAFAIRDVRIFDGAEVIERGTVLVRDGRIEAVGRDPDIPDGIAVVDGAGRTLLPGLIDAHVHAWGDAQADMLRFGVTGGLDMHGVRGRAAGLRAQRDDMGNASQADLWAAGTAVTAEGGHGTQYGFPVPAVGADTDVEAFTAERIDEGADFIKIIVEDMSGYGDRRIPSLDASQVRSAVSAARARSRLAVAHVSTLDSARAVLDAGVDGLVHVFDDAPADPAFVRDIARRDAFVVPTLVVIASVAGTGEGARLAADPAVAPRLSATQRGTLEAPFPLAPQPRRLADAIASVRALHAAGVTLLAGSDAPNPGTAQGASLHGELALLVQAGLSPAQALAAATSLPAARFGLADRGRIAPGHRADLLLVDGDPLRDITRTRHIVAVWKNGRPVALDTSTAAGDDTTASPAAGLASDFARSLSARYGSWSTTTDQMAGGASTVDHSVTDGALLVRGEVRPGFAYPWSGMMFFPAAKPMEPVDLSARTSLVFRVRGDGRTYSAMLFSGPADNALPAVLPFVAGPDWTEVRLPLADFRGADLGRVRGIAWTAGTPGAFEFALDDVALD